MKDKALRTILPLLPKNAMSQMVGRAMGFQLPLPLKTLTTKAFARYYKINMDEAEFPLAAYASIGDLFIRRLKPSARPLAEAKVVHPADGQVISSGKIEAQTLFQAKGVGYSLMELIRDNTWSHALEGGTFMTTYLCPTDYHRVHSPLKGRVEWVKHIPGELWPVNKNYVNTFPRLFVTNERLVVALESDLGKVIVVMVGATNVGKMTLSFDRSIVSNQNGEAGNLHETKYTPAIPLGKGDELGVFHMGSTVITLFEKDVIDASLLTNRAVQVRSQVETK